ncbi:MAG: alcohol dehydrogenase catalytic domain-containing protein [Alphaproteobacteria bacterium]|nr:alcohol dehydrogenase catalytic domain-containing protein [Alphaproteobacteria bacterium]
MRQLYFLEPGKFEWRDIPAPALQAETDALVKPLSVARCDLDLYIANGVAPFKGPFPFGHEAVGVVIDAGKHAGVAPGDRVIVPFQLSCGRCATCKRGLTASCEAYPPRAAFGLGQDFGGALSDLIRVPYADHMLMRAPDGFTNAQLASISDNIPDGWRAVAPHLAARPGATVLVVGGLAQSVGLYAAALAVSLGAGRVLYLDDDAGRRATAQSYGATVEPLSLHEGRAPKEQFDITVDASGVADALRFALLSTAPNGVCTAVAIYFEPLVGLPLAPLYYKGATFHTSRVSARGVLPQLLDHVACGHFRADHMVSRTLPFADAADVMDAPDIKLLFENDA